jgi:diamine N-acetyltransferase
MVTLRVLEPEQDLTYLLTVERQQHDEGWIGHDSEAVHRERLHDPASRYFIIEANDERAGFVIVQGIGFSNRSLLLKRIALDRPGQGIGRQALRQVIDLAFTEWNAHRFWLDVFDDNLRARRTYAALGFVEEGRLRECEWMGGRWRSLVVMSILENER